MGKVNKEGEERERKKENGDREREGEKKKKKKKKKYRQFASIPADKRENNRRHNIKETAATTNIYKSQ